MFLTNRQRARRRRRARLPRWAKTTATKLNALSTIPQARTMIPSPRFKASRGGTITSYSSLVTCRPNMNRSKTMRTTRRKNCFIVTNKTIKQQTSQGEWGNGHQEDNAMVRNKSMTTRDSTINQYPALMEKQKAMSQALLYHSGDGKGVAFGALGLILMPETHTFSLERIASYWSSCCISTKIFILQWCVMSLLWSSMQYKYIVL